MINMQEIKAWGEEVKQLIEERQAKQQITFGNVTVQARPNELINWDRIFKDIQKGELDND